MARKKQEVALMSELSSQEDWEEAMAKEGLCVIDVYQEWCGPCEAMVSNFRRIRNELGDDLLRFASAKADNIDALEKYRGGCEPCYLFYAGGVLVAYVHGAKAPLILRTLTEQLAHEHKVIDGSAERKEVKDPFVAAKDTGMPAEEEEEEADISEYVPHRRVSALPGDYETVEAGYTVAIIKPNAVAEGKVDEIIAEMQAAGIQVFAQEERQLTVEEAKQFYSHLEGEDYFEELCQFMASGPSHALVLTKGSDDDSIIRDWRDMLGPTTVEEAREQAPQCLRARYGDSRFMNAVHGSDSKETAARELAFFFPNRNAPTVTRKVKEIQRTLALIRPDAFATNRDAILSKIEEAGFQIALSKSVQLTREQAEEFYAEHAGQPYFEELINRMTSGPLLALGLARDDAIAGWRTMLGPADVEEARQSAPESLRAQYAMDDVPINQLHGSDSPEAAKKELGFFFPVEQTVALIKPDAYGTKDDIINKIHEAGFRIAARKETTITRDIAESFYEDQKDKDYYESLIEHMCSGPTMFMVLSRESAVEGWRQVIGPTDPEIAKTEAPESLRAKFGTDVLQNALHGSSTTEEAHKKIETIFGHLDFNADGTVKVEEPQQEAEEQAEQQAGQQQEAQQEQAEAQPEGEDQADQHPAEQPQSEAAVEEGELRPKSSEGREEEGSAVGATQEETPAEAPAEEAKTEEAPTEQAQAEEAPSEQAQAEEAPTEQAQAEEAPTEQAQAEEAPTEQAQAEEAPTEQTQAEEAPTEQAQAEEAPTEQAQAEQAPTEQAQAEEAKTEEAPAEEAKTEEAPAQEAKTEDAPADEAKSEEAKTEDASAAEGSKDEGEGPKDGEGPKEGDATKESDTPTA